jgi:hypothetical protein
LGRLTDDCVTTVGSSTDNAVLRISTTYEVRGMVATVTSYDNATPGSGTALRTAGPQRRGQRLLAQRAVRLRLGSEQLE